MNTSKLKAMTNAELVVMLEESDHYIASQDMLIKAMTEWQDVLMDEIKSQRDSVIKHYTDMIDLLEKSV